MANEITVSCSIKVVKSSAKIDESLSFSGLQFDMSGTEYMKRIQEVGTTEEALVMNADSAVPGWGIYKNLDATNYVELRQGTGVADMVRMNAGEPAMFRLAADATAPFAIANTAAVRLLYMIFEA